MKAGDLISFMQSLISRETKIPVVEVSIDLEFREFGLDSISSMFIVEKLEEQFNITISPLHFWDYPTIEKLAQQIIREN